MFHEYSDSVSRMCYSQGKTYYVFQFFYANHILNFHSLMVLPVTEIYIRLLSIHIQFEEKGIPVEFHKLPPMAVKVIQIALLVSEKKMCINIVILKCYAMFTCNLELHSIKKKDKFLFL